MKIKSNLPLIILSLCAGGSAYSATYTKSVYSLPLTLDPIKMNDTSSLVAGNLIFDGLLKFSPSLEVQEALAESWQTSSDGKVLTFKLRPNLKFHDGSPLTSEDVVYSLKRAVSKESMVRKYYDCIEGSDERNGSVDLTKVGVTAKDLLTIEVRLKSPFPAFASVLAGATAKILPRKSASQKNFFINPIGSGAFQFIAKDPATKTMKLKPFAQYYRGKSKLESLILKESSEVDALASARSGQVQDLANWPLSKTNGIFKIGKNISAPIAATWIIGLNTKKAPFDSQDMRQAFKASFDTEALRAKYYPDAAPAFGYIPPGLPGFKKSPSPNTEEFQKSFSKKITIAIPNALANHLDLKKTMEADLNSKGWKVEVKAMAWDDLMKGYVSKTHQAFLVSMNMDYPDADFLMRNFESHNPDNFSGISNKELDLLISKFRSEPDKLKRAALYKEAIILLDKLALTVNLFHPRANYWVSSCVQGFEANILSDVYIDYSVVSVDEQCLQKMVRK
ncbi:MAG TPA: ABC transporter substrate-binding protein [Bacteriovoracaceae bacterium]|nr:ABC transporter substrate-binding protein [Bacteriovoracaceae bacterium]